MYCNDYSAEGEKTSTASGDVVSSEQGILDSEDYPVTCLINFAKGDILITYEYF